MVSFKRKPVRIPPPDKTPVNENCPVWVIDQTLEYFTTYDAYLARMDFYNQKKFICELTGHSCLTYFEAVEKEAREARAIVTDFPEPPKEPILQKVQFSRTSRLDLLVDEVYAAVRHDFFVGEILHARTRDQQRLRVTVHEVLPPAPGSTEKRYRCDHEFYPNRFDIYESSELFRDRKNFNKMSVRTFIKYAASRENWMGCPWIVKKEYTDRYPNIPTEPPEDLKMAVTARVNRPALLPTASGTPTEAATPEPAALTRRRKQAQKPTELVHDKNVDDLDILAAATIDPATYDKLKQWPHWQSEESIDEAKVGKALQIWSFINVYNEMLVLSPISFDEFLKAIIDDNSEVLAEIICAILTVYVDPGEDILAVPFPSQYEPSSTTRKRTETKRIKSDADEEATGDSPEVIIIDEKDEPMLSSEPEDQSSSNHNAEEYIGLGGIDWMVRIGKRDFSNGGWQSLVICTLSESSYMREWLPTIEGILAVLANKDTPVSLASARDNWSELTSTEKIDTLDFLVQILHTAPALRQFMETRGEQSTRVRKDRAEVSREQKNLLESLKVLREKRAASTEASEELAKEYDEGMATQEVLAEKITSLSNELLHYDCSRIRLLGKDRFYNRYWWFESNGVERINLKSNGEPFFLMSRIWIQGPTAEDFSKRLNNFAINIRITDRRDRASEVAWQEKYRAVTIQRENRKAAKKLSEERRLRAEIKQVNAANVLKAQKELSIEQQTPSRQAPSQPVFSNNQLPQQPPMMVHAQQPQQPNQPQQQQQPLQIPSQAQPPQQPQFPPQMQQMAPMMQGAMRGMQFMAPNGTPMYYPQPMYPMAQNMPQGQYMMQMPMQQFPQMMGQQVMYMMPQMINGVQTLVPVQLPQGGQFGQQFPGAAGPMQMQFQIVNGQMQPMPQASQMQMPMQMQMQMQMQGHSPQGFPQMQPMQVPQGMVPIQQGQQGMIAPGQQVPGQQAPAQPQQHGQPMPQPVQPPVQPLPAEEQAQEQQAVETKTEAPAEPQAKSQDRTDPKEEAPERVEGEDTKPPPEADPVSNGPEVSPSVSPKTAVLEPLETSAEVQPTAEQPKEVAIPAKEDQPDDTTSNGNAKPTEVIDADGDVEMAEESNEDTAEPEPEPVKSTTEDSTPASASEQHESATNNALMVMANASATDASTVVANAPATAPAAPATDAPATAPAAPATDAPTTAPNAPAADASTVVASDAPASAPAASDAPATPTKPAGNSDWRFVEISASIPSKKSQKVTLKQRKIVDEPKTSSNKSDTDDDSFELPVKEKFQPLTALGLKKTVEGSLMLTQPNEWRFYDNEEELNQLELYLMRNSIREGELLEKLLKLDPTIRACFKARETVLEQGSKEWTNELAKKELGHYHSAPKGRKRGRR